MSPAARTSEGATITPLAPTRHGSAVTTDVELADWGLPADRP